MQLERAGKRLASARSVLGGITYMGTYLHSTRIVLHDMDAGALVGHCCSKPANDDSEQNTQTANRKIVPAQVRKYYFCCVGRLHSSSGQARNHNNQREGWRANIRNVLNHFSPSALPGPGSKDRLLAFISHHQTRKN